LSGLLTRPTCWIRDNPPASGSRPWQGLIDDVRVYNRALGPEEIRGLGETR